MLPVSKAFCESLADPVEREYVGDDPPEVDPVLLQETDVVGILVRCEVERPDHRPFEPLRQVEVSFEPDEGADSGAFLRAPDGRLGRRAFRTKV